MDDLSNCRGPESQQGDTQPRKRPLDSVLESDPKRARLGRTHRTHRPLQPLAPVPQPQTLDTPFGPAPTYNFVCDWLELVAPKQENRQRRCRSEPPVRTHTDGQALPRRANSLPDMDSGFDAQGFRVPPTPSISGTRSRQPSVSGGYTASAAASSNVTTTSNKVSQRSYRRNNLEGNNVYVRLGDATLPDDIIDHTNTVVRKERDSPGPTPEEMKTIAHRRYKLADGCNEDSVVAFLNNNVFPNEDDQVYGDAAGLVQESNTLMSTHLVPCTDGCPYTLSQPKPDKLYGYSGSTGVTFNPGQISAQMSLVPRKPNYAETTGGGLRFPFLVVECKAAGGTGGDLWVAANQCAGGSAACLNALECLNSNLAKCDKVTLVDDWTYSIAVDNNTAQLYVSWKEEGLNYYMQQVDDFLLSSPEHFKAFRRQVRNILDWGKDARLTRIRESLDIIMEENRKAAALQAKARPTPSELFLYQ